MYYSFELTHLPTITRFYSVTRDTIWQIADKDNILIFIKEGSCKITYESEVYTLKAGDIFYIPANHDYRREPVDNLMCTMIYIHFRFSSSAVSEDASELKDRLIEIKNKLSNEMLSNEFSTQYQNTVYLQNKSTPPDFDNISHELKGINLFSNSRQLTCSLQASVNLCNIIIRLSVLTTNEILTNSTLADYIYIPQNLKKAVNYINLHYSEPITLSHLATYCNVSKQQLIRYFKASLKTTPTQYINEHKIFRAKEMLLEYPHLTINEISSELGFDNQHYFSRVFTKFTGISPSQYKTSKGGAEQ